MVIMNNYLEINYLFKFIQTHEYNNKIKLII